MWDKDKRNKGFKMEEATNESTEPAIDTAEPVIDTGIETIEDMDRFLRTPDIMTDDEVVELNKTHFFNPKAKKWIKRHTFTREDIAKRQQVSGNKYGRLTLAKKRYFLKESVVCHNCPFKCVLFDDNTEICYKRKMVEDWRTLVRKDNPNDWIEYVFEEFMEMRIELMKKYPDPTGYIKFKKLEGFLGKFAELYKLKFGEKYQVAQTNVQMTPDQFQKMFQEAEEHIKDAQGKVVDVEKQDEE